MPIRIISDGSIDLPKELLEQWEITLVPLFVHFEHEQMKSTEIDHSAFYAKMREEKNLPKTSSPSPSDFLEAFRKAAHQDILVLVLSATLSSTYNHALMAKEMFLEENYKGNIEILDAKTTSLGLGLLAYKAGKLAKMKHSFQEIVHNMKAGIKDHKTYFYLDTLENVIRGGRLDRVKGAVASMLNIKLLMRASDEGSLELVEKVRGTQKAICRLIDKIGEKAHDFEKSVLGIAHSNCEEKAKHVKELILAKYPFKEIVVSNMGPVIGTYAGEGGILITY